MSIVEVLSGRRAWHVEQTDVLAGLAQIPDNSVHVCVTSPPYYGLRAYGTPPQVWGGDPDCQHDWQIERYYREGGAIGSSGEAFTQAGPANAERLKATRWKENATCRCGAWRGELGQEPTPDLFVAHLVEIFREVRRVLRDDGTCWINLGDSYANTGGHTTQGATSQRQGRANVATQHAVKGIIPPGLKPKDLMLMPARLALALQADGWWIRSHIIWAKKACMPESVTDRPTSAHESIFLLTKQPRYFYDAEAVREEAVSDHPSGNGYDRPERLSMGGRGQAEPWQPPADGTRNMRNTWILGPEPFPEAHFATFPTEIPRRAILAGTSQKGVCAACGAPYKRVVEKGPPAPEPAHRHPTKRLAPGQAGNADAGNMGFRASKLSGQEMAAWRAANPDQTLGWAPTCRCDAGEPIGALCLDPFSGSGTTGVVALRHGRRYIGLELNESYVRLSERRIVGDSPLFNATEVSV